MGNSTDVQQLWTFLTTRAFLFLQDPNSNRIAQWLNKTIDGGILDFSHPMIPEAVQGTYKITASTDKGEKVSHSFKIKEYGELQTPPQFGSKWKF